MTAYDSAAKQPDPTSPVLISGPEPSLSESADDDTPRSNTSAPGHSSSSKTRHDKKNEKKTSSKNKTDPNPAPAPSLVCRAHGVEQCLECFVLKAPGGRSIQKSASSDNLTPLIKVAVKDARARSEGRLKAPPLKSAMRSGSTSWTEKSESLRSSSDNASDSGENHVRWSSDTITRQGCTAKEMRQRTRKARQEALAERILLLSEEHKRVLASSWPADLKHPPGADHHSEEATTASGTPSKRKFKSFGGLYLEPVHKPQQTKQDKKDKKDKKTKKAERSHVTVRRVTEPTVHN